MYKLREGAKRRKATVLHAHYTIAVAPPLFLRAAALFIIKLLEDLMLSSRRKTMSATNILHHGCTDPQVERLIEVRRFFVANFEKISAIKCGLHFSTSLFGVEGPFNKTNSHSFIVAIVICIPSN